jgi:hypothetical protein
MKKLLLLFPILLLTSCLDEQAQSRIPTQPSRLQLITTIETVGGSSAYIVLDTKTHTEYLVVENTSEAIAVVVIPTKIPE